MSVRKVPRTSLDKGKVWKCNCGDKDSHFPLIRSQSMEQFIPKCHLCNQKFSLDPTVNSRSPLPIKCGHFVCISCFKERSLHIYECSKCGVITSYTPKVLANMEDYARNVIEKLHKVQIFLQESVGTKQCGMCSEKYSTRIRGFAECPETKCRVCRNPFSLDITNLRAPGLSACVHFVCRGCQRGNLSRSIQEKFSSYGCQREGCNMHTYFLSPQQEARGFIEMLTVWKRLYQAKIVVHKCPTYKTSTTAKPTVKKSSPPPRAPEKKPPPPVRSPPPPAPVSQRQPQPQPDPPKMAFPDITIENIPPPPPTAWRSDVEVEIESSAQYETIPESAILRGNSHSAQEGSVTSVDSGFVSNGYGYSEGNDLSTLSCRRCRIVFSTNQSSPMAPVRVPCAHYVCIQCHRIGIKQNGIHFEFKCDQCNETSFSKKRASHVATGFVDLLGEVLPALANKEDVVDVQSMNCFECKRKLMAGVMSPSAPSRMSCAHHICVGCHKKKRKDRISHLEVECSKCSDISTYNKETTNWVATGFLEIIDQLNGHFAGRNAPASSQPRSHAASLTVPTTKSQMESILSTYSAKLRTMSEKRNNDLEYIRENMQIVLRNAEKSDDAGRNGRMTKLGEQIAAFQRTVDQNLPLFTNFSNELQEILKRIEEIR